MVIIMFIVPWLKIILSNDSTDRKEALKKCEDAKESAIKVSQEREVRLQNKFDSLLNKAINDKEETIAELRKMWNKDQIIHSTIKSK